MKIKAETRTELEETMKKFEETHSELDNLMDRAMTRIENRHKKV